MVRLQYCRGMDKLPAAPPWGASASWLRQQQPDATKGTHEAASWAQALVTAIGRQSLLPLYTATRAHLFLRSGMNFERKDVRRLERR